MLFINSTDPEIKNALKEHSKTVSHYLVFNHQKTNSLIHKYIKTNMSQLITGLPNVLEDLNLKFYDSIGLNYSSMEYVRFVNVDLDTHYKKRTKKQRQNVSKYTKLHCKIERIINYEKWFIKSTIKPDYQLAKNLQRNTCTYCNRLYTNTVISSVGQKKIMRPQFDHWFSKKKHPLLALSFYNLIPSCSVCNSSVKGDSTFSLKTHIHPYVDADSLRKFEFSYDTTPKLGEYIVKIVPNNAGSKITRSVSDLFTAEMYNAHQSELHDLILIEKNYSKAYIDMIINSFPKTGLTEPEVYRILFGVEYEEKDFHKRPFSKFKSDILKELKIIKK